MRIGAAGLVFILARFVSIFVSGRVSLRVTGGTRFFG
jgi:hypothetical protein